MSTDRFLGKYRNGTFRAQWHDYNCGAYFITICTKEMEHYFGEIVNGEMCFSLIGQYANDCVDEIEMLHKNVNVPISVVMPNHIHLIVIVDDVNTPELTSLVDSVAPSHNVSPKTHFDPKMRDIANRCGRVSHIISRFKYAVTRYANMNSIQFAWQPRFYDRIIRNQHEMKRIARYIKNNVAKWDYDHNVNGR